ncbi:MULTISPECIES: ATP-dependent Clp protease proteolytic subunit [unclassified Sphingomonas]|uniref:ATP-dependent Clp protease proteolytic subunit n=1 Tax=Sphingomonas TaxID=13687 RepID=UPI000A9B0672
MAEQETLLERLIPGELEHQIPAAIQKALPGGFRNRLLQLGLGLLITFGFAFMVRRWVERREARRRALAPRPAAPALPPIPEPEVLAAIAGTHEPEPLPDDGIQATRYPLLARPHVALSGPVDQAMYASFRAQLGAAPKQGALVVSLSTPGGDPEVARLMGDEIRLLREYSGCETLFVGKVAVHSAGVAFMAAFPPDKRFLTRGTRLMLHPRILARNVEIAGPLDSCAASLKAMLHEIEEAARIEEEDYRALVAGSRLSFEDLQARAPAARDIAAEEARSLGLVLDLI